VLIGLAGLQVGDEGDTLRVEFEQPAGIAGVTRAAAFARSPAAAASGAARRERTRNGSSTAGGSPLTGGPGDDGDEPRDDRCPRRLRRAGPAAKSEMNMGPTVDSVVGWS
jgi:hypothetical protein